VFSLDHHLGLSNVRHSGPRCHFDFTSLFGAAASPVKEEVTMTEPLDETLAEEGGSNTTEALVEETLEEGGPETTKALDETLEEEDGSEKRNPSELSSPTEQSNTAAPSKVSFRLRLLTAVAIF
jgi:hypothetical protein